MGLSLATTRGDLAQAVLEGVAFRMGEVIAAMSLSSAPSVPVSIDGGMSRNPWFCQFLADVLGRPLRISDEPELTAFGCAGLAMRGAGTEMERRQTGRLVEPRPIPSEWRDRFRAARMAAQTVGTVAT